ncbi:MAG: transposase [Methanobrevibacter sp.]|nr:transposase [Candidatus Methanovirga basalitermitum]
MKNKKEYSKRSSAGESPIGDIKHKNKIREFNTRGNENVLIEVIKMAISHNIRIFVSKYVQNEVCFHDIGKILSSTLKNICKFLQFFKKTHLS